jgi:predicted nucleic acid-binding protein
MLIVADSSALIALAVCDGLGVVLKIYDDLKIPEAVYMEIVAPEKPHSDELGAFLTERVMKVGGNGWWSWAWRD